MLHEMLDQEVFFQLLAGDAQLLGSEAVRELISDCHVGADRIKGPRRNGKRSSAALIGPKIVETAPSDTQVSSAESSTRLGQSWR